MISQSRPSPHPAPTAAMAFSIWNAIVPFCVRGIAATGMRCSTPSSAATIHSPLQIDHALALRAMFHDHRIIGIAGKKSDRAPAMRGHARDQRVGGIEHGHADVPA